MNFKHKILIFFLKHNLINKILAWYYKINPSYRNNVLYLVKANGKKIKNPKIKNLKIDFRGKNNYIEIHEPFYVGVNMLFSCCGNSYTKIGKYNQYSECEVYIGNNTRLEIGDHTSIGGAQLILYSGENTNIKIGHDCMISTKVTIRTSDGHSIYKTGKDDSLANQPDDVIIGDHVWVGTRSEILKGSVIPSNTIIGAYSLVNKKFEKENCIIAGQPAKIIKEGYNWDRKSPILYSKIK